MWVHHGQAANFHDASFPGAGFFQHKMLLGRCQRASDQEFHGFCGGWSHISSHEMQGKLEALLSMAQEKGHFLVWKPPIWVWNGCESFRATLNLTANALLNEIDLKPFLAMQIWWKTGFSHLFTSCHCFGPQFLYGLRISKYHDLDIPDNSKNSIIGRPFDKPCVCFSTRSVSKNTLSAPLGILTSVFCMSNWLTHGPGSLAMRRFTGSPDRC